MLYRSINNESDRYLQPHLISDVGLCVREYELQTKREFLKWEVINVLFMCLCSQIVQLNSFKEQIMRTLHMLL